MNFLKANIKIMKYTTGKYIISITRHDNSEVAIISQHTGEICKIKNAGKKLKKIAKEFKPYLNSNDTLTFSHMSLNQVKTITQMLR